MADRNNTEVSTLVWLPREPTTPESNERIHFAVSARASQHRGKNKIIVLFGSDLQQRETLPRSNPGTEFLEPPTPHPLRANTIANPGRLIATAAMAAFTFAGNASRAAMIQPGERQNRSRLSNKIASLGCADRNFGFQFVRLACPLKYIRRVNLPLFNAARLEISK